MSVFSRAKQNPDPNPDKQIENTNDSFIIKVDVDEVRLDVPAVDKNGQQITDFNRGWFQNLSERKGTMTYHVLS